MKDVKEPSTEQFAAVGRAIFNRIEKIAGVGDYLKTIRTSHQGQFEELALDIGQFAHEVALTAGGKCLGCGGATTRWQDNGTHPNLEEMRTLTVCYFNPVYGWKFCKVGRSLTPLAPF